MVKSPLFRVGDLVISDRSLMSDICDGQIGLLVKVEQVTRDYYIYWVRFAKKTVDSPMWETEIKLFNEQGTDSRG